MNKKVDQPFGRIARDCRDANVPFPTQLVEQFERVARKLNEDWGKPAAADYLNDLLFPSRADRQGFPPEVAGEILAIKNLHEDRYANLFGSSVWDPTLSPHGVGVGSLHPKEPLKSSEQRSAPQPKAPSIYSTRRTEAAPAPATKNSVAIARLMPQTVREQVRQISGSPSRTATSVPVPASELDELLIDAERHFSEEHMNSGTALLEQLTTLYPESSPYAYLRLMEIYFRLQRREDFEWVSKRLCEQFGCDKLEWVSASDVFMANLDRLAEAIFVKMP
jgi:uncharacterized protein YcgL (UPF0745 family)